MSSCENQGPIHFNPTASVEECDNKQLQVHSRTVTRASVPVLLGQFQIRTTLSANIHFPDPVLEIKDAKKVIKLTQCALLLSPADTDDDDRDDDDDRHRHDDLLIIKGFVRKNIQYATPMMGDHHHPGSHHPDSHHPDHPDHSCVRSDLRSLTCDVPFQCSSPITKRFTNKPIRPVTNARREFDFFRSRDLGMGFPEKDHLLSNDLSQFHQLSTQHYNPFPFCELVNSRILEWDESTNRETFNHANVGEGVFTNVVEKMRVQFTVNVFQNQIISGFKS
ncbi:hypothetical protein DFP93_10914 [Aneurinibacillus soli]|uniref:DUF7852 domain-containing protein n=1 Tax=Aneurinibacillus soli TaxID=1500254 RepID=A0A0U5B0T4_9BACL|nr:DUF3794 domain-containing protein [Aneurinibacillus soli]PYE61315.1 hypothetical protein DFP93_10914 [Aneurinibacillus soli]BAU27856.1 hypothetical protein CB4_02030 [Aneurinibacillus soli]